MTRSDTPGWYVEDDVAASVKKARESDTPISSIVWGLEAAFSDDTPKERIKRIIEAIPDDKGETDDFDLPLSQPPSTSAEPREQPARIISIQDLSYLSPQEAARVIGLTLEQFDGNTVRPPANASTACNLYWNRQRATVGLRIIPTVGRKVTKEDILPLEDQKTSIEDIRSPSQLAAVTNGEFSEKAKKTADQRNIKWYDCGHVEAWLRRAKITPEALGTVLEDGENHQGPLDELVDISGIANAISPDPLEISRVIDRADLSTSSDVEDTKTEPDVQEPATNGESQEAGRSGGIDQPGTPSTSGETGTLYAKESEDGDYGAFDRFVDDIDADTSTAGSDRGASGAGENTVRQKKNKNRSNNQQDESYECAICGAEFKQQQVYKKHISNCTG